MSYEYKSEYDVDIDISFKCLSNALVSEHLIKVLDESENKILIKWADSIPRTGWNEDVTVLKDGGVLIVSFHSAVEARRLWLLNLMEKYIYQAYSILLNFEEI